MAARSFSPPLPPPTTSLPPTTPPPTSQHTKPTTGAIIGSTIGAVVLLALLAGIYRFLRHRRKSMIQRESVEITGHSGFSPRSPILSNGIMEPFRLDSHASDISTRNLNHPRRAKIVTNAGTYVPSSTGPASEEQHLPSASSSSTGGAYLVLQLEEMLLM
jgi:hypothetical protein